MSHGSGPRGRYYADRRKARIWGEQDPKLIVNGAKWRQVESEIPPELDETQFEATEEEVRAAVYDTPNRLTVAQMMRGITGAGIRSAAQTVGMIQDAADRVTAEIEAEAA